MLPNLRATPMLKPALGSAAAARPAVPPTSAAVAVRMLSVPLPKLVPPAMRLVSPLLPRMPCHWMPRSAALLAST